MECSTGFVIFAWIVIGWQAFLLLMALFEPALRYQIKEFDAPPIDSEAFMKTLEALTDAQINHRSRLTVHTMASSSMKLSCRPLAGPGGVSILKLTSFTKVRSPDGLSLL